MTGVVLLSSGCAGGDEARVKTQAAFFDSLYALCGQAFEGQMVSDDAVDQGTDWDLRRVVMHVRDCEEDVIRIPLHVADDRSRTWIISRHDNGLRLKHDHRHEDGSEDAVTQYGGDTAEPGTPQRQEFPADSYSKDLFLQEGLEVSVDNVWAMEIVVGQVFAYELSRPERFFRVEFDLENPVAVPPPAWGHAE